MKILYVEDELSQNINRALRLFKDNIVLPKRQRKMLREVEQDEYGASNEEIRDMLNASGVIDVAITFTAALQMIETSWDKYDLFIVDRQLATDESSYTLEEIKEIVSDFTQEQFERYLSREGDYLLARLISKGDRERSSMFYFMTGYNDKIRTQEDMPSLFDFGCFTPEQFLEKGNDDHLDRLVKIIADAPGILTRKRHAKYFEILDTFTDDEINHNRLVNLLEACHACKAKERRRVMGEARTFLEALVNMIYKTKCRDNPASDKLYDKITYLSEQPDIQNKRIMLISKEAKSMGLTANTLCAKYGAHDSDENPTADMLNTALFAIRGFMLEMGKI